MANATIRADIAALYNFIPLIASRSPATVNSVFGKLSFLYPFSLTKCLCERDIQKAQKILNGVQKAGRNPTGIEIKGNGQFSQNALSILPGVCSIAHTYRTVSAEVNWLSLMKCSLGKHVQFQDALWHHPTNQTMPHHFLTLLRRDALKALSLVFASASF